MKKSAKNISRSNFWGFDAQGTKIPHATWWGQKLKKKKS